MEDIFKKLNEYFEPTDTSKKIKTSIDYFQESVERFAKYEVAMNAIFKLRNEPEKLEAYLENIIETNKPMQDEK